LGPQHSAFSTSPQNSDYRGSTATKQKGSSFASFKNRFRTCRILKFRLQGASNYPAEMIKPWKLQIQNLQNSEVQTARSIQLSSKEDQTLQTLETDLEYAKFRSLNYNEYPAIK